MYARYFKRPLDFLIALLGLICLSPLLLTLTAVGAIAMGGNPFFAQVRPGKRGEDGQERMFKLVKFRTMSNKKDENGKFLSDEKRLNRYGKLLRSTSLDELPELWNILKGELSCIGPRPLLPEYLPYYTDEERRRHDVRPGLTGWAQVNGRNSVDWDTRFKLDVEYVDNLSFWMDIKIFLLTIKKVFLRSDISENTRVTEGNLAEIRRVKSKI